MSVADIQIEKSDPAPQTGSRNKLVALILIAFSLLYFSDVCLRASEKYFWYDELVTVYLCRLPSLSAIHTAVLHATDFNPPLFYIITRTSNALFGEGLIGTRVPEILGFWVLCLCLFRFVYRRAGLLAGFIALVLPMLTRAYYYAYEARPHAIVMGLCGLALVCWQMQAEGRRRPFWLIAFALCLFAAFMNHCYAVVLVVPFALAELYANLQRRRVNWSVWIALCVPALIACAIFIPLLRAYKAGTQGTQFGVTYFEPSWWAALAFFVDLVSSCLPLVIAMFVLIALERLNFFTKESRLANPVATRLSKQEIVVACGFLALPFFGVFLGKMIHGPFIPRYFMSTVIGFSLLTSLAICARRIRGSIPVILTVIAVGLLLKNSTSLFWHRMHGVGEKLWEAGTGIPLETTPGDPLHQYALLTSAAAKGSQPIAVLWTLDFLYFTYYAPDLAPRLHYVACSDDPESIRAIQVVRQWTSVKYNRESTCEDFVASHRDFLVYGYLGAEPLRLLRLGAQMKTFKVDVKGGKFVSEMVTGNGKDVAQ